MTYPSDFGNLPTIKETRHLIPGQIPLFIQSEHPQFVKFMEAYYGWMEQYGPLNRLKNLPDKQNIDTTGDTELDFLAKEFISLLPKNTVVDRSYLIKRIKDYYRSRGTEDSFKFLLRAVFGAENISLYYPKTDLLRTSDGQWYVQDSIRISLRYGTPAELLNTEITGNTSRATANVVDVVTKHGITELIFEERSRKGTFLEYETVYAYSNSNLLEPDIIGTVQPNIVDVTITNPGTDYVVGDYIKFDNIKDCYGYVSEIYPSVISEDRGPVKSIVLYDYGWGVPNKNDPGIQLVSINSENGQGLTGTPVYSSTLTYPGRFLTNDGNTSERTKRVQDGYYWQLFSYDLKSSISKNVCGPTVERLLHPAGTKRFHTLLSIGSADLNNDFSVGFNSIIKKWTSVEEVNQSTLGLHVNLPNMIIGLRLTPKTTDSNGIPYGRPLGPTYETLEILKTRSVPNSRWTGNTLQDSMQGANAGYWGSDSNTPVYDFRNNKASDFVGNKRFRPTRFAAESYKASLPATYAAMPGIVSMSLDIMYPTVFINIVPEYINVDTLTTAVAINDPSVLAKINILISPNAFTLSVGQLDPVINSHYNVSISADLLATSYAIPVPTIVAKRNVSTSIDSAMNITSAITVTTVNIGTEGAADRRSVPGPTVSTAPIPDGTMTEQDRRQVTNVYRKKF